LATFVIVHGAFGGGWEWAAVARELRKLGHDVFTPTLTGLGERGHLGPEIGLTTNVEDVVSLLEFEDLSEVVLCGASYGGMAVTGAADRASERIGLLIYVDALVPRDGQCGLDLLPGTFGDVVRSAANEFGHGWVPVPAAVLPPDGIIPEQRRASYVARLRPQPVATFLEPVRLTGAVERLPRAFVRCTSGQFDVGGDPIAPFAALARDLGWLYREIAAPHDPQLFNPKGTAAVLHDLAAMPRPDST
jgi:pimeloyl-ACP methyl ester carboxylesterase